MDGHTAAIGALPDADVSRRVLRLQILTVAWMSIEVVVALAAALTAKSPALLGFGGSAVELLSAIVVLWRFRLFDELGSLTLFVPPI